MVKTHRFLLCPRRDVYHNNVGRQQHSFSCLRNTDSKLLNEPLSLYVSSNPMVVVALQTIISTIVVIFTGEFIPKTIFKAASNFWLKVFSPLLFVIYLALYPITLFATLISKGILKLFGQYSAEKTSLALNKVDLDYLVTESIEHTEDEENVENDVKIFQNALDFSNILSYCYELICNYKEVRDKLNIKEGEVVSFYPNGDLFLFGDLQSIWNKGLDDAAKSKGFSSWKELEDLIERSREETFQKRNK